MYLPKYFHDRVVLNKYLWDSGVQTRIPCGMDSWPLLSYRKEKVNSQWKAKRIQKRKLINSYYNKKI